MMTYNPCYVQCRKLWVRRQQIRSTSKFGGAHLLPITTKVSVAFRATEIIKYKQTHTNAMPYARKVSKLNAKSIIAPT